MSNFSIDAIIANAAELQASDIHLHVNQPPAFRINGVIVKTMLPAVTEAEIMAALNKMMPDTMKSRFENSQEADFPYEIKGVTRARVNSALSFGLHALTIRLIPYEIKTIEQLGLPAAAANFARFENGIVLVTGAAGSGKSTTLASILNYINNTQQKHIITIEDPIEYVFENKKSIFTQRQTSVDTKDFASGLKFALRQDPDVILIGEIRDMETIQSAMHAAETGHLIFATLHTFNAVQTFNRVLSFFQPQERDAVRHQFAEVFRGSVSQRLIPDADGRGRACAVELLETTPTIKDFFIKDNLEEVYKLVRNGSYNNMITFNMSLYDLFKKGRISQETAIKYSDDPNELKNKMRGVYTGSEFM